MKIYLSALLIVIFWAILGLVGVRNFMRILELRPQIALLTAANQRTDELARQRIRLCEMALATESNTTTMDAAEEKFRVIQQRYGQLKIEDTQAVAIVTVPEIVLQEHLAYTWRIYVPEDHPVELAAYLKEGASPPSTASGSFGFTQTLPAGQSVIHFVWKQHYDRKRGSIYPNGKPQLPSITVSINEDDFRWQSEFRRGRGTYVKPVYYANQQALFLSDDTAELLHAGGLHLVVRHSSRIKTE